MLASVAIFAALVWGLYFLLGYPLVALYKCGKNPRIGMMGRTLWIIAIAILGPIAAAFYFLCYPSGRAPRFTAFLALATLVVAVVASVVALNRFLDSAQQGITESLPSLSSMIDASVPPGEKQEFLKDVGDLGSEMASLPWNEVSKRINRYTIYQALALLEERGTLTEGDVRFWEGLYSDRDRLGPTELVYKIEMHAVSGL